MFGEGLFVITDGKLANSYLRAKKPVTTERVLRHRSSKDKATVVTRGPH